MLTNMYAVRWKCKCGSDWVEEISYRDTDGSVHYFYTCHDCGNTSTASMIQAEALNLWNDKQWCDDETVDINSDKIHEEIEEMGMEIEEIRSRIAEKERLLNIISKRGEQYELIKKR